MTRPSRLEDRSVVPSHTFRLDRRHGKLIGVCAGIARYFDLDVTLVRIAFVLGTVLGFGSLLLIYLAVGLIAD